MKHKFIYLKNVHPTEKRHIFQLFENLYHYRFVIQNFVSRDLKERYKSTMGGFLWTLFHPLVLMIMYALIFRYVLRIQIENYSLYLLSGLIPWIFFSNGLNSSSICVVQNFNLINKVYFPRELLPIVAMISHAVHFLLSLVILIFFLIYFNIPFHVEIFWLPVVVGAQLILTTACALIISALAVFLKDLRILLELGLQVLFFACPITYEVAHVPASYSFWYKLNPLLSIFEGYKAVLLYGKNPITVDFLYTLMVSLILLCGAYALFKHIDYLFAEKC